MRQPLAINRAAMTTAVTPSHANVVAHEVDESLAGVHNSVPLSPSAVLRPTYASTQSTHLGVSASTAAGSSQRASARGHSLCRGDIGGFPIAVVITHPVHFVELRGLFVAAFWHEIEDGVRSDQLIHAASIR